MMPDWMGLPDSGIQSMAVGHPYWEERLRLLDSGSEPDVDLHLAVLVEPYLGYILDGVKTVESRFSSRRIPPYRKVKTGDAILLKRSSGPIIGICEVADVWFYRLDPASWIQIRAEFTQAMCAQDPDFWRRREGASFATLIRIHNVIRVPPMSCRKRDRRGWVVLTSNNRRLPLDFQ